MTTRLLRLAFAVAVSSGSLLFAQQARKSTPKTKDWKAIHQSAIVIDTHADTTMRLVDEGFDPANDAGKGHWDLQKVRDGNLGAEFFSIWIDPEVYKGQYTHRALAMIDSVYQTVRKHPDEMVMAYSAKDILAARNGPKKRLAALLGVEGGHAIENDVRVLRNFYRLGVRYMTLTWANSTDWAQSSGDVKTDENGKPIDRGLTIQGREIVREMNRVGMMVDISHVSDRSFFNSLTVSRAPIIASHSSSRAITNHPRNMTDEMLVALARNNGVAQVNFGCDFLSDEYAAKAKQFRIDHPGEIKKYRELHAEYAQSRSPEIKKQMDALEAEFAAALPRPPFKALIDHIDHMVKVAGVDHVGIGSDFDGVVCLPQGIDSVADLPKITEALVGLGYSEADIHKIMGGNLIRVFSDVEKVARHMQQEEKTKDPREQVNIPTTKQ